MARPPTELQWLMDFRSARRTFRTLMGEGYLTSAAPRDRRKILQV